MERINRGAKSRWLHTSALVGSVLALASPAMAQTETTAGDVVSAVPSTPPESTPTVTDVLGGVQVDLKVQQSIIDWKWFNVVDPARFINFTDLTGLPSETQIRVLNRVVGEGIDPLEPTVINGTISSSPNVVTWIVNPSGASLGSTGTVSGGTLVLTTSPISTSDFLLTDGAGVKLWGDSTVISTGVLNGTTSGILASQGSVIVRNTGTITASGGSNNGGIRIEQAGSSVDNSGLIQGSAFGITTFDYNNPATGLAEGRAIDTFITNSGTIRGLNNDGVRLIGGGTVTNSGLIEGLVGGGADGISMFTYVGQDTSGFTSVGTVNNLAGGIIFGNRNGIIQSTGGVVNNAGSISGNAGGIVIQDGLNDGGKTGTVQNSGSISGGRGVLFGVHLVSSTLTNSGTIIGTSTAGLENLGANPVTIDNQAGGSITGALKGIHAAEGAVIVTNAGSIRGNGTFDGFGATPDGGISIAVAGSDITNSGSISGARFGITTYNYFNAQTGLLEPRAVGTVVTNLAGGSIIGDSDDGVRLIGGGTVTNAGQIEGRVGIGADGVSMFALNGQNTIGQASIGTVINQTGGTIFGNRFGIILSGGGVVSNAGVILASDFSNGTLDGFGGGVLFQAGPTESGKIGTLTNGGSISGGNGVIYGANLASGSLSNSGSITGTRSGGVNNTGANTITIDNQAGGSITGALKGIHAAEGAVIVTNAGSIRGNGTFDGFGATPDGGISIAVGGSNITNSGSISGTRFGITTYNYFNAQTGLLEPRAVGTVVTNLAGGTIIGDNDDGVRLIGGGTVTNAGIIEGRNFVRADGVSMFALQGQDTTGQTGMGSVINQAGGTIFGNRFGVALSGGGVIDNAGTILAADFSNGSVDGLGGGVLFQADPTELGKIGTLTNSGSIAGGNGVLYGPNLASGSLINSGSITGTRGGGVNNAGANPVTIDNQAGGSITGALKGIHAAEGAVIVTNAGSIRGNGTFDGFGATPDGGISIAVAGSDITNSGSISGARFGITTYNYFNAQTGLLEPRAVGTVVTNLAGGSIIGDSDDGVRLIGGGTVTNAGIIEGRTGPLADGVSMFALEGQDLNGQSSIGTIINQTSGTTFGNRFGIILSGGGYINNSGSVRGIAGGVLIQSALVAGNYSGTLINSGTIENGVRFNPGLVANVTNSGTISIDSPSVAALESLAQINVLNTGTISSTGSHAIRFGSFDDRLTLGLGSQIIGLSDAGAGIDTLALDSGVGTEQSLGSFQNFTNFETLEVLSGTWSADGDSSAFTTISMLGGNLRFAGPLNPNAVIDLGGGTLDLSGGVDSIIAGLSGDASSSLLLGDTNLTVRQDSDTTYAGILSGTGSLIKDGDGRLNLTGTNTYTGPTIVSGGTLAVNGSITSPVTIQAGATLGGTGTTGTVTIEAGGTFAPGNSIGTINVAGTLRFAQGSSYLVEANAAGQSDRINVNGRAVIDRNVVVNVSAAAGNYRPSTEYIILSATDKITGQFAGVTSDLAFLQPKLSHSSKKVELTLKRTNVSFASVASNTNQAGVASVIDAMGQGSSLHDAVLVQNLAGARTAFSSLSGTFFGSLSNELVSSASRLWSAFQLQTNDTETGLSSWSQIISTTRSASSPDIRSGISLNGNGVRVAMVAGWLPEERVAAGNAGNARFETHYAGTVFGYNADGLKIHAGAGFSWHNIAAERSIIFPGFAEGAKANYSGSSRQLFAEVAHAAKLGRFDFTPYAGFSNIRVAGLDIRELGGNASLMIDLKARTVDTLRLGLRGSAGVPLGRSTRLSAHFNLAWQQAWGDLASFQQSRFGVNGSTFAVTGYELADKGLDIEAGLKLSRGSFELNAGYRRNTVFQRFDDGAEVGLKLRF